MALLFGLVTRRCSGIFGERFHGWRNWSCFCVDADRWPGIPCLAQRLLAEVFTSRVGGCVSICFSKEAGAEHISKDIFLRYCGEGKYFSTVDFFSVLGTNHLSLVQWKRIEQLQVQYFETEIVTSIGRLCGKLNMSDQASKAWRSLAVFSGIFSVFQTFSGTLLNVTWLCTKASQTFSGRRPYYAKSDIL